MAGSAPEHMHVDRGEHSIQNTIPPDLTIHKGGK